MNISRNSESHPFLVMDFTSGAVLTVNRNPLDLTSTTSFFKCIVVTSDVSTFSVFMQVLIC